MDAEELTRNSQDASRLLALLSNANRLRILCELLNGEKSVSALEKALGLGQSPLSQHLAKLREGGIVTTRREAQSIYYSIADARALRILEVLDDIFCGSKRAGRRKS